MRAACDADPIGIWPSVAHANPRKVVVISGRRERDGLADGRAHTHRESCRSRRDHAIIDHGPRHADDIAGGVERVGRIVRIVESHGAHEWTGRGVVTPAQTEALGAAGSHDAARRLIVAAPLRLLLNPAEPTPPVSANVTGVVAPLLRMARDVTLVVLNATPPSAPGVW